MKLITTNAQLTALLPNIEVTVQGEIPLIEKMATFLSMAEKWVCNVFTSDPVFDDICELTEENTLREATTQAVTYEAFRRALPHLDIILTPNGFGIVSNNNMAPASKERISRLMDALLDNRDAAISHLLAMLPKVASWQATPQAEFFRATMFPNSSLAERFPRSSESRWEQYLSLRLALMPIEEHIATHYLSDELMHNLRAQVQASQFSTDKHNHICRVLQAVEVECTSLLREMACILYKSRFIKLKPEEATSIFYWFTSMKRYFANLFTHFFTNAQEGMGTSLSFAKLNENMNTQIRALTGGDITKERDVLRMDCWRALTELDAKAKDYEELKKISNSTH